MELSMGKAVLVFGSACVDVIIRVDHLPRREENLHPFGQQFRLGGCACNVAGILGRGGADVTFVTPVGLQGVFGPWVLSALSEQQWVKPVRLPDGENGCCYCLVEPDGERTFISCHGVEYTFSPEWMTAYQDRDFDYCYICGLEVEESTGEQLSAWLETAKIRTLFYAPGPRGLRVPEARTRRLLQLHPVLHLNRREALQMAHEDSLDRAMATLFAMTGNMVIVTLGAEGTMILEPGCTPVHIPGVKDVRVVDTIGAGDAHAGAVLLGLTRGWTPCDAAAFANRVAAKVVGQEGAALMDDGILRTGCP